MLTPEQKKDLNDAIAIYANTHRGGYATAEYLWECCLVHTEDRIRREFATQTIAPDSMNCQRELMIAGKPYPRTCQLCGLFGPCRKGIADPIKSQVSDAPQPWIPKARETVWFSPAAGEFVETTVIERGDPDPDGTYWYRLKGFNYWIPLKYLHPSRDSLVRVRMAELQAEIDRLRETL